MNPKGAKLAKILLVVGQILLASIFLVAGYAKMKPLASMGWSVGSVKTSLAMFAMQVDSYQMLSASGVTFVARLLPPFEIFLGLWLLSGIALRISSVVTTLLLVGFVSVMVRAYELHLGINCGCFGTPEQVGPKRLLQDASFLALSLGVTAGAFLLHRRRIVRTHPVVSTVVAASPQARP